MWKTTYKTSLKRLKLTNSIKITFIFDNWVELIIIILKQLSKLNK